MLIVESGKVYRDMVLASGEEIYLPRGTCNAILENIAVSGGRVGVALFDECYCNTFRNVRAVGCNIGFQLIAEQQGHLNYNCFYQCEALACNRDALVLDGAKGNFFYGFHAEGNENGAGISLAPTKLTTHNAFFGVWLEDNAVDIRYGSPLHVMHTKIVGGILQSSHPVSGLGWMGYGNRLDVEGGVPQALAFDAWYYIRKLAGRKVPVNQ